MSDEEAILGRGGLAWRAREVAKDIRRGSLDPAVSLLLDRVADRLESLAALSGEPVAWQRLEPHEQEALADRIAANIGMRLVPDVSLTALSSANEEIARLRAAATCALGFLTGNMDGDWSLGEPIEMLRAALTPSNQQAPHD